MNTTRRQFMATAGGALVSGVIAGCAQRSPSDVAITDPADADIDAHSHVWTPDVDRFPLGAWTRKDKMSPASFTAEELLAVARPAGVGRVVLIQHAPYYGFDNAYMIDCAKRHPGVFSIVGMMDERKPKIAERLRALRTQGIRGLRINPYKNADRTLVPNPARWLETDGMRQLWTDAAEQRVALCPLLGSKDLPTLMPMCKRFPDTRCVIDHMGGVDVGQPEEMKKLLALASFPNVYVKVSAFYKKGARKPPYLDLAPLIKPIFEAYGPKRLMWGSDCPYQLLKGNNYKDAASLLGKLPFINESDCRAMMRTTAAEVFFG